jgi:hypothetical protein
MYSVSNLAESIVTNTKLPTSQFQLPEMQGIMTVNHNGSFPGEDYMRPKIRSQDANYEPIAMEMRLSIDRDRFSSEGNGDIILDGEDILPKSMMYFGNKFFQRV